jgi:hypothetical protein
LVAAMPDGVEADLSTVKLPDFAAFLTSSGACGINFNDGSARTAILLPLDGDAFFPGIEGAGLDFDDPSLVTNADDTISFYFGATVNQDLVAQRMGAEMAEALIPLAATFPTFLVLTPGSDEGLF